MCDNINFIFPKCLMILLLSFFSVSVLKGQEAPVITWDKTYGGSDWDGAKSIQQTSDGGYIVAGYTESNNGDISDGNNGEDDCWIIKLDGSGNKEWDKTYGGSSDDDANSIQQTSDGGYIVAGYTDSNDGDISDGNNGYSDYWIVKLDGSGNREWDKTYGGSSNDRANSIQQTSDGGYIVAGSTLSNDGDISDGNNGRSDCWIIKLDGSGNEEWDKTYGSSVSDLPVSIKQTSDEGYIITGHTDRNDEDIFDGVTNDDYWILKIDSLGNKEWDKTYGGSINDQANTIQQTSDGGYIVAGHTYSNDGDVSDGNNGLADYWIIKLDGSGNKVWDKTYGGSNSDELYSLQQTLDGGYIVAGYTFSNDGDVSDGNNGDNDLWVLKLNSSGNREWDKTYGGSMWEQVASIQQTADEGYIVLGITESNDGDITDGNNGEDDIWIIKLGPETPENINQIEIQNMFSLYPNPANSQVLIKTNALQALGEVLITDMTGKIVKQFQTQKSTKEIDVSTLENGIYFLKAVGVSQKLVKK